MYMDIQLANSIMSNPTLTNAANLKGHLINLARGGGGGGGGGD